MKTVGKITTTLALLLSLYLLSYWLLIKKGWADKLLRDAAYPFDATRASRAVYAAFAPINDLELTWTLHLPTRKRLIGHWRSNTNDDFVTIGTNEECQFQLGEFAFKGKAEYDRSELGFIMEFPHKKRRYLFLLGLNDEPMAFRSSGQASAIVGSPHNDPFGNYTDYAITLTKHPPSTPLHIQPALPLPSP
jgi:hypothetical protein